MNRKKIAMQTIVEVKKKKKLCSKNNAQLPWRQEKIIITWDQRNHTSKHKNNTWGFKSKKKKKEKKGRPKMTTVEEKKICWLFL